MKRNISKYIKVNCENFDIGLLSMKQRQSNTPININECTPYSQCFVNLKICKF